MARSAVLFAVFMAGSSAPVLAEVMTETIMLADAEISFEGGDGSSFVQAVIVKGATGEADGVQSEYAWLAKHRPGWKVVSQALRGDNGKFYDVIRVTNDGKSEKIYFDISDYWGKSTGLSVTGAF